MDLPSIYNTSGLFNPQQRATRTLFTSTILMPSTGIHAISATVGRPAPVEKISDDHHDRGIQIIGKMARLHQRHHTKRTIR